MKALRIMIGLQLLALSIFVYGAVASAAPVTGAIFTTNADGSFVNGNVYDKPTDVYLNGGPRPNAPCTAAGLPNGDYYFQVTDPSGSVLLSSDDISNRRVTVAGGVMTAYAGTHVQSIGQCNDITVQLFPYDPTTNPGGEYKVWMTPVTSYKAGFGFFGFIPQYSKTDNFKVIPPEVVTCPDGSVYDPNTNTCVPNNPPPPVL
jgi:hypothetical protein